MSFFDMEDVGTAAAHIQDALETLHGCRCSLDETIAILRAQVPEVAVKEFSVTRQDRGDGVMVEAILADTVPVFAREAADQESEPLDDGTPCPHCGWWGCDRRKCRE